jgi:protease-4
MYLMFARRHPFLFFFLILASLFAATVLSLAGLVTAGGVFAKSGLTGGSVSPASGNIGVVEVEGVILSSKKIINDIRNFQKDDGIKAIIVRINSPGGGIGPSQEIYREIMKVRRHKKVIASMGSVAASGGYYIASAADGIIANPGTITGSIGVIMEYANIMEIVRKIGISPVVIKSGEFKDMGSPLRELTDTEKDLFQSLVDELHQQFVSDAATARRMDQDKMAALSDGRVYTGKKALGLKLVDRLGNLDDAVQWAGEMAGIKEELVPVYPKEDRMTFIRRLAETLFKDINISGTVTDNFRYIIN